ncbi:hypothetical protein [Kutzneria sp. CA-103260]|uniref:hypothetical protein n=1 Tax=Kutzneria sp. CA-103260 TaxID=2802641 RepID=UPI001BAE28D8|nr:hypothetical protein [Kutzneria sp. CA-103260]
MNITVLLAVVSLATSDVGALPRRTLRHSSLQGDTWPPTSRFDFAKAVLAMIGGLGTVAPLTAAYRKEHLSKAVKLCEETKLSADRFAKAADRAGLVTI